MIAKFEKMGKGMVIKRELHIEAILNCGTEEEPNYVSVYINYKCRPETYVGKEVEVPIHLEKIIYSPMGDHKSLIYSEEICLA